MADEKIINYSKVSRCLDGVEKGFLETGVFYIDATTSDVLSGSASPPHMVKRATTEEYLKTLAKKHSRRIVVARRHAVLSRMDAEHNPMWVEVAVLKVPNLKAYRLVVAGLIIVADAGKSMGKMAEYDRVTLNKSGATCTFRFEGERSMAVFDNWLDNCRHNPDYIAALNPVSPVGVTLAQAA